MKRVKREEDGRNRRREGKEREMRAGEQVCVKSVYMCMLVCVGGEVTGDD